MTHRHYGLRMHKAPASDKEVGSTGAWKASPLIWGAVVLLIVLGIILYGVIRAVIDVASTTTPAAETTGQVGVECLTAIHGRERSKDVATVMLCEPNGTGSR